MHITECARWYKKKPKQVMNAPLANRWSCSHAVASFLIIVVSLTERVSVAVTLPLALVAVTWCSIRWFPAQHKS